MLYVTCSVYVDLSLCLYIVNSCKISATATKTGKFSRPCRFSAVAVAGDTSDHRTFSSSSTSNLPHRPSAPSRWLTGDPRITPICLPFSSPKQGRVPPIFLFIRYSWFSVSFFPSTATVTLHPKRGVKSSCRLCFCWTPACCPHDLLPLSFPSSPTCPCSLRCLLCSCSLSAVPSTHGALASSCLLIGACLHRVSAISSVRVRRPVVHRRPSGGSVQLFLWPSTPFHLRWAEFARLVRLF